MKKRALYRLAKFCYFGTCLFLMVSFSRNQASAVETVTHWWEMLGALPDPILRFIGQSLFVATAVALLPGWLIISLCLLAVQLCVVAVGWVVQLLIFIDGVSPAGAVIVKLVIIAAISGSIWKYRQQIKGIGTRLLAAMVWVMITLRWMLGLDKAPQRARLMEPGRRLMEPTDVFVEPSASALDLETTTRSPLGTVLSNTIKRVVAESQTMADEEMTKAIRKRDELVSAIRSLKDSGIRGATESANLKAALMRAEDSIVALEDGRKQRAAAAETAKRAPVVSDIDKRKAQNEALRVEAEQVQLQIELKEKRARLETLSNPTKPGRSAQPASESFAARLAREFRQEEEARLEILREAANLAQQHPTERERILRQAQKKIDALKERP